LEEEVAEQARQLVLMVEMAVPEEEVAVILQVHLRDVQVGMEQLDKEIVGLSVRDKVF
jgi:hypothetical protein